MSEELLISLLRSHQSSFLPVVPFEPGTDRLIAFDFSEKNKEPDEEIFQNTERFSEWITSQLTAAGARYAIGGYDEHRKVYSRGKMFDATGDSDEPRRLHLGTDIWGKPHTAVMAPLDGVVHSYANNDQFADYGGTIILTHQLEGHSFYTLYGHLGLSSLKNLYPGQRIIAGEIFAEFGIPSENGQWPPHLHFQLICDMQGKEGDYPGVCKVSERTSWLKNSPDPDLILQMNRYVQTGS